MLTHANKWIWPYLIVFLSMSALLSNGEAGVPGQRQLPLGVPQIVTVHSPDRNGKTIWWVKKGQVLQVSADKDQIWYDWIVKTNPRGYEPFLSSLLDLLKRVPDVRFFQPIACVDDQRRLARRDFYVVPLKADRNSKPFTAPRTGRLEVFANDIDFLYWNNSGSVDVTVTRLR